MRIYYLATFLFLLTWQAQGQTYQCDQFKIELDRNRQFMSVSNLDQRESGYYLRSGDSDRVPLEDADDLRQATFYLRLPRTGNPSLDHRYELSTHQTTQEFHVRQFRISWENGNFQNHECELIPSEPSRPALDLPDRR